MSSHREFEYDGTCVKIVCMESFHGSLIEEDSHTDKTGLMVWPASLLMCKYLSCHRETMRGMKSLELGCGVGLVGIFACLLDQTCILSDREEDVLELVDTNIALNGITDHASRVNFHWGDVSVGQSLGQFDYIMGSDIIYPAITKAVLELMFTTVHSCLSYGGQFIVSYVDRGKKDVPRNFFSVACEMGFVVEHVPWNSFTSERPLMDAQIFVFRYRDPFVVPIDNDNQVRGGEEGRPVVEPRECTFALRMAEVHEITTSVYPRLWVDEELSSEEEWAVPFGGSSSSDEDDEEQQQEEDMR